MNCVVFPLPLPCHPLQAFLLYALRTWSPVDSPSPSAALDLGVITRATECVLGEDPLQEQHKARVPQVATPKRASSAERRRVPRFKYAEVWAGGKGFTGAVSEEAVPEPPPAPPAPESLERKPGESEVAHAQRIAAARKKKGRGRSSVGSVDSEVEEAAREAEEEAAAAAAAAKKGGRVVPKKEREHQLRNANHRRFCRGNLRSSSPSGSNRGGPPLPSSPAVPVEAAPEEGEQERARIRAQLAEFVWPVARQAAAPSVTATTSAGPDAPPLPDAPVPGVPAPAASSLMPWAASFIPPANNCIAVRKAFAPTPLLQAVDSVSAYATFRLRPPSFASGVVPMATPLPTYVPRVQEDEGAHTGSQRVFDTECNGSPVQVCFLSGRACGV